MTRSSALGRALWCLGQRAEVRSALDLFVAEGDGSATLIADGLVRGAAARGEVAALIGFENNNESVARALDWMGALSHIEATVLQLPFRASAHALGELMNKARSLVEGAPGRGAAVAALLFAGEPYESAVALRHGKVDLRRHSALRALCEAITVDILFLDPSGFPADVEFVEIERSCKPLRWVVVNNINLPDHAGWVREHLLTRPDWAEVLAGHTSDPEVAGTQGLLSELYRVRSWAAFTRIHELC